MSDKVKLMKLAFEKISGDKDYLAFFLKNYSEIENKSTNSIIEELNCSEEDFYKLALCKAPDIININSGDKIKYIGDYTHISPIAIRKIVSQVNSIIQFKSMSDEYLLMAARDKSPEG